MHRFRHDMENEVYYQKPFDLKQFNNDMIDKAIAMKNSKNGYKDKGVAYAQALLNGQSLADMEIGELKAKRQRQRQ